jgi:hypothetical protein
MAAASPDVEIGNHLNHQSKLIQCFRAASVFKSFGNTVACSAVCFHNLEFASTISAFWARLPSKSAAVTRVVQIWARSPASSEGTEGHEFTPS